MPVSSSQTAWSAGNKVSSFSSTVVLVCLYQWILNLSAGIPLGLYLMRHHAVAYFSIFWIANVKHICDVGDIFHLLATRILCNLCTWECHGVLMMQKSACRKTPCQSTPDACLGRIKCQRVYLCLVCHAHAPCLISRKWQYACI